MASGFVGSSSGSVLAVMSRRLAKCRNCGEMVDRLVPHVCIGELESRARAVRTRLVEDVAERDEVIWDLKGAGKSLRAIADLVGMSHSGVDKVLTRDRP